MYNIIIVLHVSSKVVPVWDTSTKDVDVSVIPKSYCLTIYCIWKKKWPKIDNYVSLVLRKCIIVSTNDRLPILNVSIECVSVLYVCNLFIFNPHIYHKKCFDTVLMTLVTIGFFNSTDQYVRLINFSVDYDK